MNPRSTHARIALAAIVVAASLAAWACTDQRDPGPAPATDQRAITAVPEADTRDLPALGEALLVALAQAKNYHHKADIHLQEADLPGAVAALGAIQDIPFPAGAPEEEDVKLDASARLAKLLIAQGALDDAMTTVDRSIERATRESFFLANLYTVKGEVFEARAHLLDDDHGADAAARAKDARRAAIEAFDRSIAINTALQRSLVGGERP